MNFTKILQKSSSFQNKSSLLLRSCNSSRLITSRSQTSQLMQKRLLMTSIESKGIAPFKRPRRVIFLHRAIAAGVFVGCTSEFYFMWKNEDEINQYLGTDLNFKVIGLTQAMIFGYAALYVMLAATFPF